MANSVNKNLNNKTIKSNKSANKAKTIKKDPISWQALGLQKVMSIYLVNDLIKRSKVLFQKYIVDIKQSKHKYNQEQTLDKLNKLFDDPLLSVNTLVKNHIANLWDVAFRLGQVDSTLELKGSVNSYINKKLREKQKNKSASFSNYDLLSEFENYSTFLINNKFKNLTVLNKKLDDKFNKNNLTTFAKREKITQEDVTINESDPRYQNLILQPKSITNENLNINARKYITAYGTRYADLYLKKQVLNDLQQNKINPDYISSSKFGKIYAQKRQIEIARNFTNQYKQTVKNNITNYVKSGLEIKRDKDLIEILSGERIANMSDPMYGLNQEARDSNSYKEPYKSNLLSDGTTSTTSDGRYSFETHSMHGRIERIAKTELAVAYNLGSMDAFLSSGIRAFKWQTSRFRSGDHCAFCSSLDFNTGEPPHLHKLYTISDIAFNYNTNDFRNINTKYPAPADLSETFRPPAHPYCYCRLVPLTKNDEEKLNDKDKAILGNLSQNSNGLTNTLIKAGAITGAVLGVQEAINTKAYLDQQYKEAELRNQEAKIAQIKKYENILKTGALGSSIFLAGLGFYSLVKSKVIQNTINYNLTEAQINVNNNINQAASNILQPQLISVVTPQNQSQNIIPKANTAIKLNKAEAKVKITQLSKEYNEQYTKQWRKLAQGKNAAISKEFARIEKTIFAMKTELMLATQNNVSGMFGDTPELTMATLKQRIIQTQAQLQGLEDSLKEFNGKVQLKAKDIQELSYEYGVKIPKSVINNHEKKYTVSYDKVISKINNKKQELEKMVAYLTALQEKTLPNVETLPEYFNM